MAKSSRTSSLDRFGKRPGDHFASSGRDQFYSTKVGIIIRVDELNMKADVKVLTGYGERSEIDLTQAMAGPRSFWGGIPEEGSLVILGYRRTHRNLWESVILGYLPVGNKSGARFDPWSPVDPSEVDSDSVERVKELFGSTRRYKRLMMKPGNVGGMSSQGSELVLSHDVLMTNRAGDFFELRDSERTLVSQSIHSVVGESGVRTVSGPIRRSAFFLSPDVISEGRTLKSEDDSYYGRDELQNAGPGFDAGGDTKLANSEGELLEIFNDYKQFPRTVYSNGRSVHYVPTSPAVEVEDADSAADVFVERRLEMSHTSDLSPDVLEEADGFNADQKVPFIEQVYGTVVGNDLTSTSGQRQYGKILKPRIFSDFNSNKPGRFTLEEVVRSPTDDLQAYTSAAAYLFQVRPPRQGTDTKFSVAVSKQGKFYVSAPGSQVEDYISGSNNISGEIDLKGALKLALGASRPDNVSLKLNLAGGISGSIGHNSSGRAIDLSYNSSVRVKYRSSTQDDEPSTASGVGGVALQQEVLGNRRFSVSGVALEQAGSKSTVVDGGFRVAADRYNLNAFSGFSGNYGEKNEMVSGKSQAHHALAVIETIVSGGKISTILAGGLSQTVAAGAISYTAAAGATTFNNPAGAFNVTVGTGAIAMTTAAGAVTLSTASGAMSLAAGAGAVSLSAGLALNMAASTAISMVSPQILFGGPPAVLGVCRGAPALPPGAPTLDYITGSPLLGSALIRSL